MENDPRSHRKRLCSCDLVWFRGSFLSNPQKRTKRILRHYRLTRSQQIGRVVYHHVHPGRREILLTKSSHGCQHRRA
jgi:hypothetical protein